MQPSHVPLREQYANRWRSILEALGVPARALVNRHGPCPVCGGKDRFRFDNKAGHGTWICSQCGAGDGPTLAMLFRGWTFAELLAHLGGGIDPLPVMPQRPAVPPPETTDDKRRPMGTTHDVGPVCPAPRSSGDCDPTNQFLACSMKSASVLL